VVTSASRRDPLQLVVIFWTTFHTILELESLRGAPLKKLDKVFSLTATVVEFWRLRFVGGEVVNCREAPNHYTGFVDFVGRSIHFGHERHRILALFGYVIKYVSEVVPLGNERLAVTTPRRVEHEEHIVLHIFCHVFFEFFCP